MPTDTQDTKSKMVASSFLQVKKDMAKELVEEGNTGCILVFDKTTPDEDGDIETRVVLLGDAVNIVKWLHCAMEHLGALIRAKCNSGSIPGDDFVVGLRTVDYYDASLKEDRDMSNMCTPPSSLKH